MNFNILCLHLQESNGWSQAELARRIGLTPPALCNVLKGRRPLPATAAIELFDLTNIHPRTILESAEKLKDQNP